MTERTPDDLNAGSPAKQWIQDVNDSADQLLVLLSPFAQPNQNVMLEIGMDENLNTRLRLLRCVLEGIARNMPGGRL